MTGELTLKITRRAWELFRSVERDYMVFTRSEPCLRFVLNPETFHKMDEEFKREWAMRSAGAHQGYYIQSLEMPNDGGTVTQDSRIFGIKVMTDPTVPEDQVELRAVLAKTWEPVN